MRALKVYESYNFQRGEDPLKSVGLGKEGIRQRILAETKWDIDFNQDKVVDVYEYGGFPIVIIKLEYEKYYQDKTPKPNFYAISHKNVTYFNTDHLKQFKSPGWARRDIEQRIDYLNELRKIGARVRGVKESANFERGIDPKQTMGLGLPAVVEKIPEKIYREDKKNQFPSRGSKMIHKGAIAAVYFSTPDFRGEDPCDNLLIKFYLSDYDGELVDEAKIEYAKKIVMDAGISYFFEDIDDTWWDDSSPGTNVGFKIKDRFRKYFSQEYFPQEDYEELQESIRFERGMDPKEAMSLGLNAKVMNFLKWVREDYQFDKKDPDNYMGYLNVSDWGIVDSEGEIKEGFRLFVKDWRKYLNIMANMGLYLIDPPDLDETIFYDEDNPAPGVEAIRESVNFERGLDPYKSMKIGQSQLVPKDIEWDLDPLDDYSYDFIGVEQYIPNWRGIPILIVHAKDRRTGETGYYAITNTGIGRTILSPYGPQRALKNIKSNLRRNKPRSMTESVSFERGLDPKDAMGIGENTRINSKLYRLKELDKEEDNIILQISAVVEDVERYNGLWITTHNYYGPQKLYLRNLLKETGLNRYLKGILEETSCEEDSRFNCGTREYRYEIKKEYQKYFIDTDQVNESANFERGKDPIDAMNIGQKAMLKERASKIEWDWYPDPTDEEEVLGLETWKGINKYNIKIAKLLDNEGNTAYYAVSDTGEPYFEAPTFYETPGEALHFELIFLKEFDKDQDGVCNDCSNEDFLK